MDQFAKSFGWEGGKRVSQKNLQQFLEVWCAGLPKDLRSYLASFTFEGLRADQLLRALLEANAPLARWAGAWNPGFGNPAVLSTMQIVEPELRLYCLFGLVAPKHNGPALQATAYMRSFGYPVSFPVETPVPEALAGTAEDAMRARQPLLWRQAAGSCTEVRLTCDSDVAVMTAALYTEGCPSLKHLTMHLTGGWGEIVQLGTNMQIAGLYKVRLDPANITHAEFLTRHQRHVDLALLPEAAPPARSSPPYLDNDTAERILRLLQDFRFRGLGFALWQYAPENQNRLVDELAKQGGLGNVHLLLASQADVATAANIVRKCRHIATCTLTRTATTVGTNLDWRPLTDALTRGAAMRSLTLNHVLDDDALCSLIATSMNLVAVDACTCKVPIAALGEALERNTSLNSLKVQAVADDPTDIDAFARQLACNRTLTKLDLGCNFNSERHNARGISVVLGDGNLQFSPARCTAIRQVLSRNAQVGDSDVAQCDALSDTESGDLYFFAGSLDSDVCDAIDEPER
jgi:hypothetical protein